MERLQAHPDLTMTTNILNALYGAWMEIGFLPEELDQVVTHYFYNLVIYIYIYIVLKYICCMFYVRMNGYMVKGL